MTRVPTNTDVFQAIAEPRRREILELLARHGEHVVGAIVAALGLAQPAVSKHLAVLRKVGLVGVERRGRERVYSINADAIQGVHEWAGTFEALWSHKNDRIKARAERLAAAGRASSHPPTNPEEN